MKDKNLFLNCHLNDALVFVFVFCCVVFSCPTRPRSYTQDKHASVVILMMHVCVCSCFVVVSFLVLHAHGPIPKTSTQDQRRRQRIGMKDKSPQCLCCLIADVFVFVLVFMFVLCCFLLSCTHTCIEHTRRVCKTKSWDERQAEPLVTLLPSYCCVCVVLWMRPVPKTKSRDD